MSPWPRLSLEIMEYDDPLMFGLAPLWRVHFTTGWAGNQPDTVARDQHLKQTAVFVDVMLFSSK